MKRFVCRDIIPGCAEVITGPSDQSVLDQVISHVAVDHGLVKPPLALVELVVATTQTLPTGRSRGHLRLVGADEDDGATVAAAALCPDAEHFGRAVPTAFAWPGDGTDPVHDSYRHECLLYRGYDQFTAMVVPFIRQGLALDQPVMVAVSEPRLQAVRDALGDDADRVTFADMAELGRNPALLIPACLEFTQRYAGRPVRGVGEPVWAGRGAAELAECQLHEALMNVAVDAATALWLICPYDVGVLDDAVVAEALRSHSAVTEPNSSGGSQFYGGARHAAALFAAALPEPVSPVSTIKFNSRHNHASAGRILRYARAAGLPAQRSAKLAAAADEVALAGLGHDGGVRIRLWQQDGAVICEVGDRGTIDDPLVGRSATFGPAHRDRGIRLANELCDLVQVRSSRSGTTVRMHSRI